MEQRPASKLNSSMEKDKLELIRAAWSGVISKSELGFQEVVSGLRFSCC